MTPEQAKQLTHFKWEEWEHPERIWFPAAQLLEKVRRLYANPLTVTSDARSAAENAALPGSSETSLHVLGRAFDLRYPASPELAWDLVWAVMLAAHHSVELELVHGPADKHCHIGLYPTPRPSRLLVRAD